MYIYLLHDDTIAPEISIMLFTQKKEKKRKIQRSGTYYTTFLIDTAATLHNIISVGTGVVARGGSDKKQ